MLASDVPDGFTLGRPFGDERAPERPAAARSGWPSAVREETEPLRKRNGSSRWPTSIAAAGRRA